MMIIERALAANVMFCVTAPIMACSSVTQQRIGIDAPPEEAPQFAGSPAQPSVGDYLDKRCGSLDCHGQVGRNLRIWGCYGMRLADAASGCTPPNPAFMTTPDEYEATYRSLVGLEPVVMSQVVQSGAAHPELLTFVRKAYGLESHKGGHLITPGDEQDQCITSWLAGNTDVMACETAYIKYPVFAMVPPPMPAAGSSSMAPDASP